MAAMDQVFLNGSICIHLNLLHKAVLISTWPSGELAQI